MKPFPEYFKVCYIYRLVSLKRYKIAVFHETYEKERKYPRGSENDIRMEFRSMSTANQSGSWQNGNVTA